MTKRNSRRGSDLIVDALIKLDVRHAFNVIGLGMYDLGDAFYERRSQIEYVSHLNETNLALAAQGYARVTRKPAFCFLYYSSGTALAMPSMVTAWADRAPMVFVSISNSRTAAGRDPYAAVPCSILEMGRQFSKWSFEIPSVERIPEFLARAYADAGQAPMGPVHLSIPADMLAEFVADDHRVCDFKRLTEFAEFCADEDGLRKAAQLLVDAERPILMVGSEVGQLGASAEMIALAERLGAPMMTEDMASYLGVPTTHHQYVGTFGPNHDLRTAADVILAVGVEFTELGLHNVPPQLTGDAKLISLSVDGKLPMRQLWPDLALTGHPRASLAALGKMIDQVGIDPARRKSLLEKCSSKRSARQQLVAQAEAMDRTQSPVHPQLLTKIIAEYCGQDWSVMSSGTSAAPFVDTMFEIDDTADFHQLSGKGSCQGWGAPVSIGVQLAQPDRRVMAIVGDGNLMFTGNSIWAAAKYKLPMVFVIINNGGWGHIPDVFREVDAAEGCPEMGWTFEEAPIDYVKYAMSLGLEAGLARTGAELADLLEQAGSSARPWLIEVRASRLTGGMPMVTLA
jgi:thiamine pyrophosphate-dependent acetolactate synthase large subunit-like protein